MQKSFKYDFLLLLAILILSSIGLLTICSASPTLGIQVGDSFYYIKRHVFLLIMGLAALTYAANIDLSLIKKNANLWFIISVVLLLLVYVPGVGRSVSGASRWIEIPLINFQFQPSELIKLTMILFLANLLAGWQQRVKDLTQGLLPILCILGLICAIIMKQPDMGTTIIVAATAVCLLFFGGSQYKDLAIIAGSGLAAGTALAFGSAYRVKRLVSYLDPWKDPQGSGFQIIQSLLAVGSGGFWGLGIGASRQKYFYLPQQFTDFIFAIICEEMGFIGAGIVIAAFILFASRGLKVAQSAPDRFQYLLACGITSWITLQALINMMVVVGLIPTTGIPLPFISYGGTSTISVLFACGILLNISKKA